MDNVDKALLIGAVALVGAGVFPFAVFLTAKLWRYGALVAEERFRRRKRGP